ICQSKRYLRSSVSETERASCPDLDHFNDMETQMRPKWIAPLAHRKFFDLGEKLGRHSLGGKKAKITAARLCCLILRRFRSNLRQGSSTREASCEQIDRFSLGFNNFRRGIR